MSLLTMKQFLIFVLAFDFVYSQFGLGDSWRLFQASIPFFREANKLAANSNFPRFSGLSNSGSSSNPSLGCNICSFPDSNEINYYTRLAQQLARESNFPNIPNTDISSVPQISNIANPDLGSFIPPTPAPPPLERRPSFKYPEIKNSLNSANSRLKTIQGGPRGGGLDLLYRIGK